MHALQWIFVAFSAGFEELIGGKTIYIISNDHRSKLCAIQFTFYVILNF